MIEMENTISSAVETAKTAARKAGEHLLLNQGNIKVERSKAIHDDLLSADLEAEQIIIETLTSSFPEYGILSEEREEVESSSPYKWSIDPLDGSANYQHGSPLFGISIALLQHNEVVGSVIYLPARDEMFTAVKGKGAELNGQPIKVSNTTTLSKAFVHVGDFAKNGDTTENKRRVNQIGQLANMVERIRMIGTAATDLAYLACGRADALIINSAHPWDMDAGRLMVLEAGGKISEINTGNKQSAIMFTNGFLQNGITKLLSDLKIQESSLPNKAVTWIERTKRYLAAAVAVIIEQFKAKRL